MNRPALFLDRDGVINIDYAYVHKKEDFMFIDGIFDLCRKAQQSGYLIIIITNQAGIGRGYYSEEDFHTLNNWMINEFANSNVTINATYFCPYHPEKGIGQYKQESACRKPNPGMILKATDEFDIDLRRSVLIGDKDSDIQAGLNAGIGKNFLFNPKQGKIYASNVIPTKIISSHQKVIQFL